MNKYTYQYNTSAGPDENESGRCYEVVHTQPWENGACLPPLAERCTEEDAARIAGALNRNTDNRSFCEFEVWNEEELYASVSGPRQTALAEAYKYYAQCPGPARMVEVVRHLVEEKA